MDEEGNHMSAELLADLSNLFSIEAFEADMHGQHDEADRLWTIADELHDKSDEAFKAKVRTPGRKTRKPS